MFISFLKYTKCMNPNGEKRFKKLRITHHSPSYWRVTFDNPPLNLLDPEVTYELRDLMNQMEVTKELKVVVFDSANPDFYIGHVDLIRAGEFSTDVGPTGLRILPDFLQRLAHLPIISIASIRGRARGVGAEFIEGLDIRFGSREKMILGQIEVGSAVVPGGGGSVYLPLLVGRSRALEIIASSEDYDADIAERYGWINRAIPDAELDAFVDRFARRIASFDKEALTEAKRLINRASILPDDAQLAAAEAAFFRLLARAETQTHISKLMAMGLQQQGEFELRLGHHLGNSQVENQ
jgi:enoyl-CoA hydratase/carnithine racemase